MGIFYQKNVEKVAILGAYQWCPSWADDFATQPISLKGAGIQNS